jgi:hypothetical protein
LSSSFRLAGEHVLTFKLGTVPQSFDIGPVPAKLLTNYERPAVSAHLSGPEGAAATAVLTCVEGVVTDFVKNRARDFMPVVTRGYQRAKKTKVPKDHSLMKMPIADMGFVEFDNITTIKFQHASDGSTRVFGPDGVQVCHPLCPMRS